jgi:hypothetical protein
VLLSGPLEKDVGPGVNEESRPGFIRSLTGAPDSPALIV